MQSIGVSKVPNVSTGDGVVKGALSIEQNIANAAVQGQREYVEDKFWPSVQYDLTKWDRYCPYQLLVVESVPSDPFDPDSDQTYRPYKDWRYTFPLPPESLSRDYPFAVQLTPTLDGVVEEHNGIPIRPIAIRGTTGFLPGRGTGATRSGTGALSKLENQVKSIFGGTVSAINRTISAIKDTAIAATNGNPTAYNVYQTAEFSIDAPNPDLIKGSGFNQILLLKAFLENYAAAKKSGLEEYKKLRLAFAVWKEDDISLCTPVNFSVVKSVGFEYDYALTLKAWRRIKLDVGAVTVAAPVSIRKSPNLIAQAINTLTAARRAVQEISTLKQAVLGDIDYVFRPFHDSILLCKDMLGASLSVADIPLAIRQRVEINVSELKYSSNRFWNELTSNQTGDKAKNSLKYAFSDQINTQDLSIGTKNPDSAAQAVPIGHRSRKIIAKDIQPDLAEQVPLSTLQLDTDTKKEIAQDLVRVRNLRRKDFEDYANTLRNVADKMAFLVGAGDPSYAETYGIDLVPLKSEPSNLDWESLIAMQQSIEVMQQFAATAEGETTSPTTLDVFGGLAARAGIAWKKPVSKFAIPFPFGATLERLASMYLGDPNRWLEIVALNGLRSPFVDEVGYRLALLVNGAGQAIVVPKNTDLFVGKTVWLSSNVANRRQFKIDSIQDINGSYTIKLSDTVDEYKTVDNSVLEAFATGTTCSRNLIWIPSDVQPVDPESIITKDIPGVDETDPIVAMAGIDILTDNNGDMVIVDDDLRYATGLANIVQWVRLVLSCEQGELLQHPSIGLPLSIGLSLADFKAQDVMRTIKDQLSTGSLFSRIDRVKVVQNGPTVDIKIDAVVAGTSSPLPLSYGITLT